MQRYVSLFLLGACLGGVHAAGRPLAPKSFVSGAYTEQVIEGTRVWVPNNVQNSLFFDVPSDFPFVQGQPVFVEIEYFDNDYGYLLVQYDSAYGGGLSEINYPSETHTRSSRVDSGRLVKSYHVFENPLLANRQSGGTDFRIRLRNGVGDPLQVSSVAIRTTPFEDEQLKYAFSKPWLQPPTGQEMDLVDAKSVRGKVMTGYQGWFSTPNDLMDRGWNHWGRGNRDAPMDPEQITVDMWPWMHDYEPDAVYPAGSLVLEDGRPAYVFSSSDLSTVRTHFRWMRQYNIDGVYLQRFVTKANSGYYGAKEFVLHNVRQAAHEEGRVWAIEYDISSLDPNADPFTVIKNDWNWLVNEAGILSDPRYLHENGKPVLFIWGFSVNGRNFTLAQANEIVNWFRSQNLYLIGGVPNSWENKTDWHGHYQRYDQLLAWMEGSESELRNERQTLEGWGMKILPHAWPGFSWSNLKQLPAMDSGSYKARERGTFYWQKLVAGINSGADQLFLGMFDEYDEATAIMPMSSVHPGVHGAWGHYIDNAGRDPFWWLQLSAYANEMLVGARPFTATEPTEAQVHRAGYTGPDATLFLGSSNREEGLSLGVYHDGLNNPATFGQQDCRVSVASPDLAQYLYFDVQESFLPADRGTVSVMIEAEVYAPQANTTVKLQYDSETADYQLAPLIATPMVGAWVTLRWFVDDAAFRGGQNGGSDFRLNIAKGKTLAVRRMSVYLPDAAPAEIDPAVQLGIEDNILQWSDRLDATGWRLHRSATLAPNSWSAVSDASLSFSGDGTVEHTFTWAANPQFFILKR